MQKTTNPVPELRAAVIGTGHLGKFHAEKYAALRGVSLVGIADTNVEFSNELAARLNTKACTDYRVLLDQVDAVSIATPTTLHHQIARDCLAKGIHVLLEKPITVTTEEADELIRIAARESCILQVGHLQHFHPALRGLADVIDKPTFIETHRLAPFNARGTDVNVVLDLMIHDIDLVLSLVGAEVSHIAASGAAVLSDSIDIANVRISFENGCVANITASRVSQKTERKMRIFQANQCWSVDLFQHRVINYFRAEGTDTETPVIESDLIQYENNDALKAQIKDFLDCIRENRRPLVAGEDGRRALATAMEITAMIERSHHKGATK